MALTAVIGSCETERFIKLHLASKGLHVGPKLYDGNADGVNTFHAKCDKQGLTLTLAPTSQGPVGGIQTFTGGSGYGSDSDAVIFTETGTHPCVAQLQNATYNHPSHLPTWGGGHCLCLGFNLTGVIDYSGAYMNNWGCYKGPTFAAANFVVQNVVVFKLIEGPPVALKSKISEKLQDGMNSHFPWQEIEILPAAVELEANAWNPFSGASTTVEQINCSTLDSTKGLAAYCSNVPAVLRSLKRVLVNGEKSASASAIAAAVTNLKLVFSEVDGASAPHTLILKNCSSDVVCAIVKEQLPQLARLVLKSTSVDLDQLLPLVAKNQHLEELSFGAMQYSFQSSETLGLVRQCPHISFNAKPDLAVPPPNAAAALQHNLKPVQAVVKVKAFNKLCKEKEAAKLEPPIALATATWGKVVPLERKLVPRFQTLHEILSENNDDEDEGEENIVPMGINPPVREESVVLAVHFVSHYVTDDVHRECARAEQLRGGDRVGDEAPVAGQQADAGGAATYTWCAEFAQFRTAYIQQRYAGNERVHVMCELMAIACFLNCPSLKRFLRAALVMEEMEEATNVDRGKRDRGSQ